MAPVIGFGAFSTPGDVLFGSVVNGRAVSQIVVWSRTAGSPGSFYKILGIAFTGADAARFTTGLAFPFNVFVGSFVELPINFTPNAIRVFNAVMTISYQFGNGGTIFTEQHNLVGTGVAAGSLVGGVNIEALNYPGTPLATPQPYPGTQFVVQNYSDVNVTLNTVVLASGTQFAITSPLTLPQVILPGTGSPVFGITLTPLVLGGITDTLTATFAGGATTTLLLSGTGIQIVPAFILSGATKGTLFGFGGSQVYQANPNSFNTEEPGSLVKLHDFNQPNIEKQTIRVRGHYSDLGQATILITAKVRRLNKPDEVVQSSVPLGTVAADGTIREFMGDVNVKGELVQLTISRAANSGPVWIIDYFPEFVPGGEVIAGS